MPVSTKASTITGYTERSRDSRLGRLELHARVVNRDSHAIALARKKREVLEFLAKLQSKPAAK